MARNRSYSRLTREALIMLGNLIRIGRMERNLTSQDLAERAGISRTTLSKIEKGDPGSEIGLVFELAALVGVPLFGHDERNPLKPQIDRQEQILSLLPQRVRHSVKAVDDDF